MKKNESIKQLIKTSKPKRKIIKNMLYAFLIGGLISLIAQLMVSVYDTFLSLENSKSVTTLTLIATASLLTGLGIYDKIGQIAGAGSIIPITGFANSMTSCAIESKSEGMFLGIITNIFKLAGSVIIIGAVSSFVVASVMYLLEVL